MLNEINHPETPSQFFEIELTTAEVENILSLLPQGFTLERVYDVPRMTPTSSKKHSIHDLGSASRNLDNEFDTVSNQDLKTGTNNKRTLRDHSRKKIQEHLEHKFNEYDTIPTTSSKPWKPTNEGVKKCYNLLQKLKRHAESDPFLEPVDVVGLGLKDYFTVIKEPMDLSTVENRLKSDKYSNVNQFATDIRKIWSNAQHYNPKESEVHKMAVNLSAFFEKNFKEMGDVNFNDTVKDLEKKVEKLSKQITELHTKNSKNHNNSKQNKSSSANEKALTKEEKKILCQNIKKLPPEHLKGVWEIVSEGLNQQSNTKEVLEFDINSLPVRVTRELDKYVKHKMSTANKSKNKSKTNLQTIHTVVKTQKSTGEVIMPNTGGYHGIPIQQSKYVPYNNNPQQQAAYSQSQTEMNEVPPAREDDNISKSSESSFISDSDSDTEIETTHKKLVH